MSSRFHGAQPMDVQIAKAGELADLFLGERLPAAKEMQELDSFIDEFNALIAKARGRNSFRYDRLDREKRAKVGLTLSRRRYDKMFRLAARLEDRFERFKASTEFAEIMLVSKAGLVADLQRERLITKPWSLSFIAYYAARMKLRSEFTIFGQAKPFDTIAQQLLEGCFKREDADWFSIAHVFPRSDVLDQLTEAQKGQLLGRWHGLLADLARRLRKARDETDIDIGTMIVRRGNDSSTWNTLARAFNQARDHWIALTDSLGLEALFEVQMPGKVMRLMAADVAAWHQQLGRGLHPDTRVWQDLPPPWLVMTGQAVCTRALIEQACRRHGVDPSKGGWSAPRARTQAVLAKPTPELVHGVSVSNPYLASTLKRMGAYSGKPLRTEFLKDIIREA